MVCDTLYSDNVGSSHQQTSSAHGALRNNVSGMESVVVTITGYAGDEKVRLIKLINTSGALYVGNLRRGGATHLICWRFYGDKYELAKKFGIHIINHRWIEDCIQSGVRLSESSYTSLSGNDVGPVSSLEDKSERYRKMEVPKSPTSQKLFEGILPNTATDESIHLKSLHKGRSPTELKSSTSQLSTYIDDILGSDSSDKELELLLSYNAVKREKEKIKNQTLKYKAPKKCQKYKPVLSPARSLQKKYGTSRNKSSPVKRYVSLSDDSDEEDFTLRSKETNVAVNDSSGVTIVNVSTNSCRTQEQLLAAQSARSSRREKLMLLSDSVRDKKKRKVVRTTEASSPLHGIARALMAPVSRRKPCPLFKSTGSSITKGEASSPLDCFAGRLISPTASCQVSTSLTTCYSTDMAANKLSPTKAPIAVKFSSSKVSTSGDDNIEEELADVEQCPVVCTLVPSDIVCVICHTENVASTEGILACGHNFCFVCIKKWASEVGSKKPTCPLCKAPFDMITKREHKYGNGGNSFYEDYVVPLGCSHKCQTKAPEGSAQRMPCVMCGISDSEELLLVCNGCGMRSAHTFCLDPPLPPIPNTPWSCGRCSQRRRAVDTSWWYDMHSYERIAD